MTHDVHLDHECRISLAETALEHVERLEIVRLAGMAAAEIGGLGAIHVAQSRHGTNRRPVGA